MDIIVDDKFDQFGIGYGLHYLEDPSQTYTFETLPQLNDWKTSNRNTLNFGFSKSSYWLRFSIENQSHRQKSLILELAYPLLDNVHFFIERQNNTQEITMGNNLPLERRPISHSNLLVPIDLLANEQARLTIHVSTESTFQLPLTLWEKTNFLERNHQISSYMGIFFGVLIAISIYHLLIFVATKDKSFLYYGLFTLSILISFLCLKGFFNLNLWQYSVDVSDKLLMLSICGGISFSCLFSNEVLAIPRSRPFLARALRSFTYAGLLMGIISLFFSYAIMIQAVLLLTAIALIANAISHVIRVIDGYPTAKYILLAGIFSICGIFITILEKSGFLPHSAWLEGAGYAGVLLMSMLYAFSLSYQINLNRSHKERMQRKLLHTQARLNADLDKRVEERTHEKEKMATLLKTTKALSLCDDKIGSAKLTLQHIQAILPSFRTDTATLYLIQKNSDELIEHPLWQSGEEIHNAIPLEVQTDRSNTLNACEKVTLTNQELILPIKSNKKRWGYLTANTKAKHQTLDFDLLENMAQSLALSMESIEAEENSRLSSIGAMAAAIVHDLKNPIGAIKGCAELASHSQHEEERTQYLSTIIDEASRMSVMAHEVLEFSRNDIQLSLVTVDPNEYLKDISKLLSQVFAVEGIQFEAVCNIDRAITLDTERIRRAILNIATNARDALASHRPKNPKCVISFSEENGAFVVNVSDNGPGIPNSIKAILFEPFVTHGKANGTGLGMAIVKKTIRAHQGDISFVSSPDQGTEFKLQFPMAFSLSDSPKPKEPTFAFNRQLINKKVLVAEDNPVNQKVLVKTLESFGISCETANNGTDAVNIAKKKALDLILMDIEMPVLNGIEASRRILKQNHHNTAGAPPIIALTGHSIEDKMLNEHSSLFRQVISKPYSREALRQALLDTLARKPSFTGKKINH